MAVVNSVSAQGAQRIDQIRYPVVDNSEIMEIRGEIVEETSPREVEDKIYVAVGKDLKESQSILRWALHNSGGRQICILHVHQPAEKIPIMGTKFRINQLEAHQVKTFHDEERQTMHQLIDKYKQICREVGVSVEVQHIEMESIEKGIVELLLQHNSKKAIYVRLHAAASCQIQFICKGKIIFTRQSRLDGLGASISSPSLLPDTNSDSEQSSLRSKSVGGAQNTRLRLNSLTPEYHRGMSDNRGIRRPVITLPNDNLESTPVSRLNAGRASDEWSVISQRSPSIGSRLSTCSSDLVDDSALIPYATIGSGEIRSDYSAVPGFLEDIHRPSPPSVLEGGMNDELYDQLERAMAEAGNSRRDAFEESIRRRKAEKDAMEAKRRVKRSESLYANELRQRREIDEELEKTKEEHEDIKKELDEVAEELRMALEQKSFLESQVADFDQTIQELEQKMFSAVELLQNYKKERDELQVECDDALRSLEELREKQAEESSSSSTSRLYTEFSFSEIKDATCNFDPSLKIGEGGYGSIFRGFLRHTDVAIKMLNSHSLQGSSEFHQEYLSGGSLEDRLNCKDNTPPLSWQNRIRIAAELCSVLIFLHSCDIVHGDLKPANLLLDKNLVSKLSDFGICRVLSQTEFSSNYTSLCCRTSPKGTFVYMDPEFISTGELTSKSDTLLTGKSPLGLTKEVQHALNKENLKNILDPTAGDWPFVQAQQLALLAMNCCDVVRENRPDLASEVWKVLEPMRVSCGLSSFRFGAEGRCQIPHYFNCPIFQEMMQDPVVAADGYTYEAEALRGWLDSGHNTSPMTNLELANSNLVPNRALKSAIQEWLQQS
ncbi:Protein kinase, ATP binding site-containing protein [Cynara cardunculus var. scolymus]|uniref:RING-type E3 ubiquitin transferase n=1 Tax=Cynara cardunculus var. scolymus TaxID=59895 RepID=A0A103XI15_CYNCS|nr:Protein kinase, ATP binding site-containing protein [Cynara cardunculus var. scolymus]